MRYNIFKTLATAVMLLTTLGGVAANAYTVTYMIDNSIVDVSGGKAPGIVEYSSADGIGTITVTPADGYYLTAEYLTVTKTIAGGYGQTRADVNVAGSVIVEATDADADPSGKTTYTFSVSDTNYDYEITANFQSRISISEAVVTLEENTFTYTGEAIKPAVASVVVGQEITLSADDYKSISYVDSINTGKGTVVVRGGRKYTGEATAEYTITQAAGSISFAQAQIEKAITDGSFSNKPTNNGDGTVTYASGDYGVATVDANTGAVTIKGFGETTITATVTDGPNYAYDVKEASYKLIVGREFSTITAKNQTVTYNGRAQAYNGATVDKGSVVITYFTTEESRSAGEGGTTEAPTNAGVYYVQATQSNDLYSAQPVNATFIINAAAMSVTAKGYEGICDGNNHSITVSAPNGAVILYGTKRGSYNLRKKPMYKAVGTYTVYFQVTKGNYSTVEGSAKVVLSSPAHNTSVFTYYLDGVCVDGDIPAKVDCYFYSLNGKIDILPEKSTYVEKKDIVVRRVNVPDGVIVPIAVKEDAAPSGKTSYNFELANRSCVYYITVHLHTKISIKNAEVSINNSIWTFTGKPIEPQFKIQSMGLLLKKDTDYTITYKNNVNANIKGEAPPQATIYGMGKYEGGLTYSFTIQPKNCDDCDVYFKKDSVKVPSNIGTYRNDLVIEGDGVLSYSSSNLEVATIDNSGNVTVKGKGKTEISLDIGNSRNYTYSTNKLSYIIEVIDGRFYGLWISGVQVTDENKNNILGKEDNSENPVYVYNPDNETLLINNAKDRDTIETTIPNLSINLKSQSENQLGRVIFNNLGDRKNKGKLKIFTYANISGSLSIECNKDQGVISGFEEVTLENLHIVSPPDAYYVGGEYMDADTIVRSLLISEYIAVIHKQPIDFGIPTKFEDVDGIKKDLRNSIIDDVAYNLSPDDYYDSQNKSLVINSTSNDDDMNDAAKQIQDKNIPIGSSEYSKVLNENNINCLAFRIPDGQSDIIIEGEVFGSVILEAKVGNQEPVKAEFPNRKGEVERTRSSTRSTHPEAVVANPFDEHTRVVYIFLSEAPTNTRTEESEMAQARIYSIRVKPISTATTNPAVEFGFSPEDVEEVVTEGGATGIESIRRNVQDNNLYDLQGRKVPSPAGPGIYIRNHKKIIIK